MKLRHLFFLICILATKQAFAQFVSAEISITGLTCSMCSYSVEKQLRQLDFIKDIKMELNNNKATVSFIPGKKVDIEQLSKKVYDAGFSVGALSAVFNFDRDSLLRPNSKGCFEYAGDTYCFVNMATQGFSGEAKFLFVDKGFVSREEYAQWKQKIVPLDKSIVYTGHLYHITL